jgi:hypothetical protein
VIFLNSSNCVSNFDKRWVWEERVFIGVGNKWGLQHVVGVGSKNEQLFFKKIHTVCGGQGRH